MVPAGSDAQEGADLAIRNAERLLAGAKVLARSGDHAAGCSLLVLACEEAEKAYLLGMLAIGANPEILGAGAILSGHSARHMRAKVNNLALAMSEGAIAHLTAALHLEAKGALPEQAEMRRRLVQAMTDGAEQYAPGTLKGNRLKESQEWLSNANMLKQRGLYVDWIESKWSTPDLVTSEVYHAGVEVAAHVIESRRDLLASLGAMPQAERAALVGAMSQSQEMLADRARPKAG